MTLSILDEKNYSKMLYNLYKEDELFVKKWNLDEGQTLDEMVELGAKTLLDNKVVIYVVVEAEKILAYLGKEVFSEYMFLTGFFIKVSHRNKDFVRIFFKFVKEIFGENDVYANIHKNNIPAIKFLTKNGTVSGETGPILTFKLEKLCLGQQH